MNALVVYDSVFGNTGKVANKIWETISAALDSQGQAEIIPISEITSDQLQGVDLLVVGSPTRGFRPTESVSKFLKSLPKNHLAETKVAAFDTRIDLETINSSALRFIVDKGGYAASTIAKSMQKKGGRLIAAPEGFLVTGEKGPLKDRELERAASWVKDMLVES
jgi:flavodoxin